MYVKLTDGDATPHTEQVNYAGDMNNIRDPNWHQWNIILQDFVDNSNINLANVKTIIIGFGDGNQAATDGTVYFDDIRLYTKRCFPGYYPVGDFVPDCTVNFYDFAALASAWLTNNHDISLDSNDNVNIHDLAIFCDYWLWQLPYEQSDYPSMKIMGAGYSQSDDFGESLYAEESTIGELAETAEQSQLESESESQTQEVPEDLNETPGIWLVYDGNTLPAPGDEITVYIHSDPFLLTMATEIQVTGDANIISAMGEADCNSFGWDSGVSFDPYYDVNSWFVDNFFVDWDCTATGTVSYLKFRYNSGVVTIFFTEYNLAYDAYGETVLFSEQPLVFGDPNQN